MRYLILAAIAAASCYGKYLTASDLRFERHYETYMFEQMYRDFIYGTVVSTAPVALHGYADAYMDVPGLWWFPVISPGEAYSGLLATTDYTPVGLPTTGVTAGFSSIRTIPSFIQPMIFDVLVLRRPTATYGGRPSSPASAVPEPSTVTLTLAALLLCLRRATDRHFAA